MPSDRMVTGANDRVPCPWCGKFNDFRDLEQQQLMDTGHIIGCDFCGQTMEVGQIRLIKAYGVRQSTKAANIRRLAPAPQARRALPGQVRVVQRVPQPQRRLPPAKGQKR